MSFKRKPSVKTEGFRKILNFKFCIVSKTYITKGKVK